MLMESMLRRFANDALMHVRAPLVPHFSTSVTEGLGGGMYFCQNCPECMQEVAMACLTCWRAGKHAAVSDNAKSSFVRMWGEVHRFRRTGPNLSCLKPLPSSDSSPW